MATARKKFELPAAGFDTASAAVAFMDEVYEAVPSQYRMNGTHHWGSKCHYPGRHPAAFIDWCRVARIETDGIYPPQKRGQGRPSPSVTEWLKQTGQIPAEASPDAPDPGGEGEFGQVVG